MTNAPRDNNNVPSILGVSSVDGTTPTPIQVNPANGKMKVEVSGGSSTLPFDEITDPATDAAVTTAKIDAFGGTVITLTTTGNSQTLASPTLTDAGKFFIVANDNNSTDTIDINGITIHPGQAVEFIWDGGDWSPLSVLNASEINFIPGGGVIATDVQSAIEEVNNSVTTNSRSGVITGFVMGETGEQLSVTAGTAQTIDFSVDPINPTKSALVLPTNIDILVPTGGFWFFAMKAYDGTYNYTGPNYTASTIAFNDNGGSPDTITDSANGFLTAGFVTGDLLNIAGSTSNDGRYIIDTVTAGVITLYSDATLTTESAGASVTIDGVQHYDYPTVSPTITFEWKSGADWVAEPLRILLGKFFWNVPKPEPGFDIIPQPGIQYYEDPVDITFAKQSFGVQNLGGNKINISDEGGGVYAINKTEGEGYRYGKYGRAKHQGTLVAFDDIININALRGHLFNLLNSSGTANEYIPHVEMIAGGLYENWWEFYDNTVGQTPSDTLTPTALAANKWTVIDIVVFGSGQTPILVWGQKFYDSLGDAELGASGTSNLANARIFETFIAGRMIMQNTANSLQDLFNNQTTRILPGNKFRIEVSV